MVKPTRPRAVSLDLVPRLVAAAMRGVALAVLAAFVVWPMHVHGNRCREFKVACDYYCYGDPSPKSLRLHDLVAVFGW